MVEFAQASMARCGSAKRVGKVKKHGDSLQEVIRHEDWPEEVITEASLFTSFCEKEDKIGSATTHRVGQQCDHPEKG